VPSQYPSPHPAQAIWLARKLGRQFLGLGDEDDVFHEEVVVDRWEGGEVEIEPREAEREVTGRKRKRRVRLVFWPCLLLDLNGE
jgi:hypothetical protein